MTDGGFLPDGTFRHLLYFDSDKVEALFRAEVLRLLLKKQLITEQTVNNMLSWRNSGFSVNATVRVDTIGCNSHTDTAASSPTAYRHDIVESRDLRLVGMCEQGPGSLEAIALHESSEG